jgi:hypothetical protein
MRVATRTYVSPLFAFTAPGPSVFTINHNLNCTPDAVEVRYAGAHVPGTKVPDWFWDNTTSWQGVLWGPTPGNNLNAVNVNLTELSNSTNYYVVVISHGITHPI